MNLADTISDIPPAPQSLAGQEGILKETGELLPSLLSWGEMESRVRKLIKEWDYEVQQTKLRRAIRKLDVNQEALRADNRLNADEILIGVRVVDENIKKEKPIFANYLTQSRRLAIFDCTSAPKTNVEPLEIAFTKGMNYSGFTRAILKAVDGAQTHGWDSVEILYDSSKPLHCGVEHIGHENLIFAKDSKDIQAQEFFVRSFDVTKIQLKRFVKKHGFDEKVVNDIIRDLETQTANEITKNIRIYKYYCKVDGIVFVGWCSLKESGEGSSVSGWLKQPQPLDMGRRTLQEKMVPKPQMIEIPDPTTGMLVATTVNVPTKVTEWVVETEEQYPVKLYLYDETEEQCITSQKGRVFYDTPAQESQSALYSLIINGGTRASNIYAAPVNPSSTGGPISKTDVILEHGCVYSEPMQFFHTDYPPHELLLAADSLNNRKSQELGQTAAAVINRDDARKTAEELKQARGEQAQMGTVPIIFFSGFMREVLSVCWYVVQSQALQGLIILLPIEMPVEVPSPVPGLPPTVTLRTQNDIKTIGQTYDIKPAGDTDVVRREEKIQRRMVMLPILQPTAVYPEFLMDLIREMLPEDADKYNAILQQGIASQQQQMLAMAQMLQEATTDESGNIKPEWQQFSGQLQQMFAMIPKATQQPNGNGTG